MMALWQDLRFAIRSLSKAPGFTALAAFTLALGIGANTAIFSVVQGVVLEPLPYEDPDELVRVWPQRRFSKEMLANFEDATASGESAIFSSVSGHFRIQLALLGIDTPEKLSGSAVVPAHFDVLAGRASLGRTLRRQDREPGAEPVVVLSHSLWQRRFAADPDVIGQTLRFDGMGHTSRTVVGVMPEDFEPLERDAQFWIPVTFDASKPDDYRDMMGFVALARLAPGVTPEQAETEVRALAGRLQQDQPDYHSDEQVRSARVTPLHDIVVGEVRPILWVLLAAVG
ncbi:MAG: ABC transporter permease [Acidobacteriota bacterium]